MGAELNFTYGADLARYKQVRTVNNVETTTHYIDKLYEVDITDSGTTTKAYISDIAIINKRWGSSVLFNASRGCKSRSDQIGLNGTTLSGNLILVFR